MQAQDFTSNGGRTVIKLEQVTDGSYMVLVIRDGELIGAVNQPLASANVLIEMLKAVYRFGLEESAN